MSVLYPERMFTRQAVRELDRRAHEQYRMPGIVLMENASRGLTSHAIRLMDWPNQTHDNRVLIVCGGGNNGGDGMAAARHLSNVGLEVTVMLTKPDDSYQGDARANLEICHAMGLPVIDGSEDPAGTLRDLPGADLVIDALLGTGLDAEVRAPAIDVIHWMNTEQDAPVIAVDTPSGLDCDTGQPLGDAVRADLTVTFAGVKIGFLEEGARRFTGDVKIVGIGVPRTLIEELGERIKL